MGEGDSTYSPHLLCKFCVLLSFQEFRCTVVYPSVMSLFGQTPGTFVGSNNSTCFCQCDNVPLQSGTEVNPWFYAAPVVICAFSIRMKVYVMHRING